MIIPNRILLFILYIYFFFNLMHLVKLYHYRPFDNISKNENFCDARYSSFDNIAWDNERIPRTKQLGKNLFAKHQFENYHHTLSFGVTRYCNPSNYFAQLFAVCRFKQKRYRRLRENGLKTRISLCLVALKRWRARIYARSHMRAMIIANSGNFDKEDF